MELHIPSLRDFWGTGNEFSNSFSPQILGIFLLAVKIGLLVFVEGQKKNLI